MDGEQKDLLNTPNPEYKNIYHEYQPKILCFITKMVGELEAEDLTQEIFIKIHRALPEFRGESKLSTWIYRISTNTALDHLRSSAHKQASQQSTPISTTEGIEAKVDDRNLWTGEKIPSPEIQIMRQQMSACVQEYIQKLPEKYRIVLALSEFTGLSNNEIADIMGITMGTVKIRLHRAREQLKKDLIATCPGYWVEGNEFLPDLKDL